MTLRANFLTTDTERDKQTNLAVTLQPLTAVIPVVTVPPCYADVLGVRVGALDMAAAVARIEEALATRRKGFICVAGVHGIMEAQRNPEVWKCYADAFMTTPDGMPTVWVGRWQGLKWMQRVAGPDLMLEVFRRRQFAAYTHFLYGGRPGVVEKLSAILMRRFPWARIVGTYTPPFRELHAAEEKSLLCRVQQLKPSIIWVGISTPRQELFMRRYLPLLDTTLMFGVGAAFDFHIGRIKDSPDWVKRAGLQWLHRLIQDPRHLLIRYLRNNPEFIWRIAMQFACWGSRASRSQASVSPEEQMLCDSASDLYTGGGV